MEGSYSFHFSLHNLHFTVNSLCATISFSGNGCPLRKGEMPMQYVTYEVLIQFGLLIVAIIGLVVKICHKDKK